MHLPYVRNSYEHAIKPEELPEGATPPDLTIASLKELLSESVYI